MKEQFASYEIALALKELGFNEPCFGFWDNSKRLDFSIFVDKNKNLLKAPLWQQVIDWFREKYDIHIYIDFYDVYVFGIKYGKDEYYNRFGSFEMELKTFEEAREQSILKTIELCKNKE